MHTGIVYPLSISGGARNTTSPLDFDLLKTHLGITNEDLDDLVTLWESVAVEWAEDYMQRAIMSRQFRFVIKDFPRCGSAIRLPMGKTISVDSLQYSDGGNTYTIYGPSSGSPGSDGFQEDLNDDSGGLIMPNRNATWPSVDSDVPAPVVINFTSGWATVASVPVRIKHALMFTVADLLELRSNTDLMAAVANNGAWLTTRQNLLADHRILRVY